MTTSIGASFLQMIQGSSSTTSSTAGLTLLNTSSSSSNSLFGPAAQVSLGDSIPSITGFPDYTSLGSSGLWQFDLTTTLTPQSQGVPQTARSEQQQEADTAALEQAFDYIETGLYDEARTLIQNLLDENPTYAAAVHALGCAELSDANYEAAEQLFEKAHALAPDVGYDTEARNARILQQDDDAVFQYARTMVASPLQRDDGVRLLITLTERNPSHTEAHMLLGDSLLDQGDGLNGLLQYDAAIGTANNSQLSQIEQQLTLLADASPEAAFVRQLVGKAQLGLQRYETAVQTLTLAADLADNQPTYRAELAKAYCGVARQWLARGDVNLAMTSLLKAKDLDSTGSATKVALAEGYIARAERYTQQRDYDAALQDYDKASDLLGSTGNKTLRERAAHGAYALGRNLERQRIAAGEDIDGEVLAYQVAFDLDPDNLTIKRRLAIARNALGDQHLADEEYEQAASAYRRAHDLFQYDTTYRDNMVNAFVMYGDEQVAELDYDAAIEAYRQAYHGDQTNLNTKQKLAGAYNARGLDYIFLENQRAAVADFKEALRLFPDNAEYQANYDSVRAWDY